MNKKDKAIFTTLGIFLITQSVSAKGPTTLVNLTETSVKISEMDMDKDFGKAGQLLDSFYAGTVSKGEAKSSPVVADQSAVGKASVSALDICNAKPSKIVLPGKVPPLTSNSDRSNRKDTPMPLGPGILAAGALALGIATKKTKVFGEYFDNYGEDLQTVWNHIKPGSSSEDTPTDPYKPPSSAPSNPYEVHPSGGAVTCVGDSCGLP